MQSFFLFPGGRFHHLFQKIDILACILSGFFLKKSLAGRIKIQRIGFQHHFGLGQMHQFPGFHRSESSLDRAPAADDPNILHPARGQCGKGLIRNIGLRQFFMAVGKDASHINRNIAHPDDHCLLGIKIETFIPVIRMRIVPTHEFGGGMASFQVLPGNSKFSVTAASHRVKHCIVMIEHF